MSDIPYADTIIGDACRLSWIAGYQTAVEALRSLTDEFGDEQVKAMIPVLADLVESVKP